MMVTPSTTFRASKLEGWEIEAAKRLKELFKDKTESSQKAFGKQFEIGTGGMVSQYINAKRPIGLQAAIKFARGLGVSVGDISPNLAAQLPKGESAPTVALVRDAWPEPSFEDAVRVIALRLIDADDATRRRAVGVLADIATEPKDYQRIAKAVLAVIDTGKRRAA